MQISITFLSFSFFFGIDIFSSTNIVTNALNHRDVTVAKELTDVCVLRFLYSYVCLNIHVKSWKFCSAALVSPSEL
jgi:hypothetical protein